MNLISIDLELNQPSRKIIELGYTIFNAKTGKILLTKGLIVNPNEPISQEIVALTGITDLMIWDVGTSLAEAYNIMCEDCKKFEVNKHPVQWGTDHFELRNALGITWEDYVFRRRAHDIKSFYQLYQAASPQGKIIAGLGKAMQALGLEWDMSCGPSHRGVADSYNTVLVYLHLVGKMVKYDKIEKVIR